MSKNDPANIDFLFGDNDAAKDIDPRVGQVEPDLDSYPEGEPTRELYVGYHVVSDGEGGSQMNIQFNVQDNDNPLSEDESFDAIDELLAIANNTVVTDMLNNDWEVGMNAMIERIHGLYHSQPTEDKGNEFLDGLVKAIQELKKAH